MKKVSDAMTWKGSEQLRASLVEVGALHTDPENARKHDARNLGAIRASLLHFGQQKPIVVDKDNRVIAGNGTLAAALEAGWTHIAVVRSDLTDPVALRAFGIADNRTAELAEWDLQALSTSLASMTGELQQAAGWLSHEVEPLVTATFEPRPPREPTRRSDADSIVLSPQIMHLVNKHRKDDETVSDVILRALQALPQ